MKKIKKYFAMSLFLGICLYAHRAVLAHEMWINVTDYSPEFYLEHRDRASTKTYFGFGSRYPVDDFLPKDKLKDLYLIMPDGSKKDLQPQPGGFLATQINFEKEGGYIVSAILEPGFYSVYVENGKLHCHSSPKGIFKKAILSLYYEQYAKSLINVGEPRDDSFLKPVGHKLEIIPLENPYKLRGNGGDFLSVKVLFEGKPARFCNVYATYSGFSSEGDFAYASLTNANGIAKLRLIHWGPWLIKAELRLPATKILKLKCNELTYIATLTFHVP